MSSLKVLEIEGKSLPNLEKRGKSDPFVEVEYLGSTKKTETKDDTLDPTYGEVFEWDLQGRPLGPEDCINVTVKDYERIGRNRLIGTATISLRDITRQGNNSKQVNVTLVDGQKRATSGKISMRIDYNPPKDAAEKQTGGADDRQQSEMGGEEGGEEGVEGEEGEGAAEGEAEATGGAAGGPAKKRRKKRRRGRQHNLPDKPTDFQVRIKVIEGRQLAGANIHPVVKVTLGKESKQTRVKSATNRPHFDESFFFNFNMRPNELFDQMINFEVLNSRKLLSDAIIGTFQCDVGLVYDEDSHALVRKWILLTAPEDKMGGTKEEEGDAKSKSRSSDGKQGGEPAGYLKITAIVLGPGDEIPDSVKAGGNDDSEDIEGNLLRPAGVTMRPATFLVKVYRAEDIPQMDTGLFEGVKKIFKSSDEQKELVDPYVKFSFAGQKAKTQVFYNNDHPEFNQELRVAFKFPSMCERLKLQMFDWDRIGKDDCIGTAFIPLSAISGQGDDGFLPSFGPCFVNFYGSTREYSDLPDEYDDLNMGIGEGCGYRGRLLVELDTRFGDHADPPVHDIMSQELIRVQTYLRRRKFKLYASFISATMLPEMDGPVEFEVSIGNYGNKLDTSVPPMSSSTPPTNAVFDGANYYYLPWNDSKPCCVVDSHWEDIHFRLDPLNQLYKVIERLEANMKKVDIGINAKALPAETAALLIRLLDSLIADCSKPLPAFDATVNGVNELDLKLQEIRNAELQQIVAEARNLREQATDVHEAMEEINSYLNRLHDLCTEPQNSMPDIVIWMISGSSRIAYHRIPTNEVLFSPNADSKGRNCAKIQTFELKYPGKKGRDIESHPEIPAQLRVIIWFGLEKDQENWTKTEIPEAEYTVFAETYENQMSIPIVGWTAKGLPRPAFSDSRGEVKLAFEKFNPPEGWSWDNEWFIDPELSLSFEADSGHKKFLEDAFENESRVPGGNYGPASVHYTDVRGDAINHRDEIQAPEGWVWEDDWKVDVNRAVDEEGWEYCVEATLGMGWGPAEKTYHMCRRRRWIRSRVLMKDPKKEAKQAKEEQMAAEGWEYAPVFGMKFHAKERKMDMVRRRRWHRKMVNESPGAPPIFRIEKKDKEKPPVLLSPRMFLSFKNPHKYQLRAYIYQARDVMAKDNEGVSDPYAKISFENHCQITRVIKQTVCPEWDQTLIFEDIQLFGVPSMLAECAPVCNIELFDKDQVGKDEYLGRCSVQPLVKLKGPKPPGPKLLWYPIMCGDKVAGELLAAFELFLDEGADMPFSPPKTDDRFIVPNGIRPVMVRTGIEILCWGVRNMKKYQLANVSSPNIQFEVGGKIETTKMIKNASKNPNFDVPTYFLDVYLPKDELYSPPLNIRVMDNRSFGRKPTVGLHVVKSLAEFAVPALDAPGGQEETQAFEQAPERKGSDVSVDIEEKKKKRRPIKKVIKVLGRGVPRKLKLKKAKRAETPLLKGPRRSIINLFELSTDEGIDWWSKYYASSGDLAKAGIYLEKGYDKMMIYRKELEEIEEYGGFTDFVSTFHFKRGKDDDDEDEPTCGELKGQIKVYPLPADPGLPLPPKYFKTLPMSTVTECIVRVYIIKAIELQPQDSGGKADPYVVVELGKKKVSDKDNYCPNTVDPIFGRMFEIEASIPIAKDLKIKIMDYDLIGRDDLIGETVVDLENRYLTKYRATCGLPQSYHSSGTFQWRDVKSPKEHLERWCERHSVAKPQYLSNTQLVLDSKIYKLEDFEEGMTAHPHLGPAEQRLALHVLNMQNLVPEHIETRSIYNPLQPTIEQGQVEMWVDIFPKFLGAPGPAVNIAPRQPKNFELRMILWNTADVIMDETSITGEQMSDIYVKSWMEGIDDVQKTDIHYRSLNGEGNFNWRKVFPFLYMPAEKVMIVKEKKHFWSLDETEERLPPSLIVQVWDNDKFSSDDFLGTITLTLDHMPKPAKSSEKCSLQQIPRIDAQAGSNSLEFVDLFQMKRCNGWWPVFVEEGDTRTLTGKVEMTLEILAEDEAALKPAGKGRDDPNQNPKLDEPNRPATSFFWFSSPWKTLKFILWRRYKWYIIGFLIFIILLLFVVLLLYSMPGYTVKKIFRV
ncbi:myoferlin-like isoform X2 [Rhopilema esculentum]|uniref:myoferlin-like isoform X2 n=1 Tax=Rhopilema esculentum TaxID=499914 RepID=UPI0031D1EC52